MKSLAFYDQWARTLRLNKKNRETMNEFLFDFESLFLSLNSIGQVLEIANRMAEHDVIASNRSQRKAITDFVAAVAIEADKLPKWMNRSFEAFHKDRQTKKKLNDSRRIP